jgi:hypothetical protein
VVHQAILTSFVLASAKRHKKRLLIIFCDVVKAFDSVTFEALKEALALHGFPENFANLVSALTSGGKAKARTPYGHTLEFGIHRGCKQGDPPSPVLFSLLINMFIMYLKTHTELGFKMDSIGSIIPEDDQAGYVKITAGAVLDDVTIYAGDDEQSQEMAQLFINFLGHYDMSIHFDKK